MLISFLLYQQAVSCSLCGVDVIVFILTTVFPHVFCKRVSWKVLVIHVLLLCSVLFHLLGADRRQVAMSIVFVSLDES
jgi:hypothetical protein